MAPSSAAARPTAILSSATTDSMMPPRSRAAGSSYCTDSRCHAPVSSSATWSRTSPTAASHATSASIVSHSLTATELKQEYHSRRSIKENRRMPNRYVVFSHGKDSGPWGKKITALVDVARSEGYEVESVDYRGLESIKGRSDKLIEVCKGLAGDLVLVGSSLGGFVAVSAASPLPARGVF